MRYDEFDRGSPLDRFAYADRDGKRVLRSPTKWVDPDTTEPPKSWWSPEFIEAAKEAFDIPGIFKRYIEGQSDAEIARETENHRSKGTREHHELKRVVRQFIVKKVRRRKRDQRLTAVAQAGFEAAIRDGGATIDVFHAERIVRNCWAVGQREFGLHVRSLSPATIELYLRNGPSNWPLGISRCGDGWDLDRVRLIEDEKEAQAFGNEQDQDAIFHLLLLIPLWLRGNAAA
jgi:hypothetical protein